jgi:hypothetical protein
LNGIAVERVVETVLKNASGLKDPSTNIQAPERLQGPITKCEPWWFEILAEKKCGKEGREQLVSVINLDRN